MAHYSDVRSGPAGSCSTIREWEFNHPSPLRRATPQMALMGDNQRPWATLCDHGCLWTTKGTILACPSHPPPCPLRRAPAGLRRGATPPPQLRRPRPRPRRVPRAHARAPLWVHIHLNLFFSSNVKFFSTDLFFSHKNVPLNDIIPKHLPNRLLRNTFFKHNDWVFIPMVQMEPQYFFIPEFSIAPTFVSNLFILRSFSNLIILSKRKNFPSTMLIL